MIHSLQGGLAHPGNCAPAYLASTNPGASRYVGQMHSRSRVEGISGALRLKRPSLLLSKAAVRQLFGSAPHDGRGVLTDALPRMVENFDKVLNPTSNFNTDESAALIH